jgi:4-alpha-glucanotransferase
MSDRALATLACLAGLAVEWTDYADRQQTVPSDVLRTAMTALGIPCSTDSEVADSHRHLTSPATFQTLPPLLTAIVGEPVHIPVGLSSELAVQLQLEDGRRHDVILTPRHCGAVVPSVDRPGYHRIVLNDREVTIAVAPRRAITCDDIGSTGRLWGLAAQVYSLRHEAGCGVGDAAAVAALARETATRGAAAVALSPLHALFPDDPSQYGPYSPSSRLFMNPLYAAPQLIGLDISDLMADPLRSAQVGHLEKLPLIDWPGVSQVKFHLLRALFERFVRLPARSTCRHDFAHFRAERGDLLATHARFEVLRAALETKDWRDWPTELRDPTGRAVAEFARTHEHDIEFHIFLQWVTQRSLEAAQMAARSAGMPIGLIADLAVGLSPAGSQAWSQQPTQLRNLSIGAPPDLFNRRGQDWGITSFSSRGLIADGFAPFLATLRAALAYAGGVRIDHALGLRRLWVIPRGADPSDGVYLRYPLEDLLNLLVLESHRHRAIIIGEDLGTVPLGFREQLDARGLLGVRVLWFEQEGEAFRSPNAWDRSAAAMTSTHDLPTVAGWWQGRDITTRAAAGMLSESQDAAGLQRERAKGRDKLWAAFQDASAARGPAPPPDQPASVIDAAVRFVARTRSQLCLVPLEDLAGMTEQPNIPGTIDQHPNWRRRLPRSTDRLLQTRAVARRVASLTRERPKP